MRVRRARVPDKLCVQITFSPSSLEEPSVSVVDQRAWLATGAVRRLLLRTVLVLGGAFAATVIGWLFCAGSASADVLPSVPTVPSVLSSVASDATAASATTHAAASSVTHAAASVTTDVAAAPKKVEKAAVATVSTVGKQAHRSVTQVTDRVAPSMLPATELVKHTDLVPLATRLVSTATQPVTKQLTTPDTKHAAATKAAAKAAPKPSAHPVRPVSPAPSRLFAVVQHRHVAQSATPQSHSTGGTSSPAGAGHHSPAMPPLQPAGSSNSSAHSGGGVAGGPGGAQVRFTHVLGAGLTMADTSSAPRIAAGPGRQPGTSPD
jgi:hypothetical protein